MPIETGLVAENEQSVKDAQKVFDLEGARNAKVSEDQIFTALKTKFGKQYDFDGAVKAGIPVQQINDSVAGRLNNQPLSIAKQLKLGLSNARDQIIDLVKPVADSVAVMAGASAGSIGGPPGAVAGGTAAGIATDALLQKLQSQVAQKKNRTVSADIVKAEPGGVGETLTNAVQNVGLNELLGKVFTTVGGKVKSLMAPVSKELSELKPTFSQYNDSKFGSMIENIWGAKEKESALKESSDMARQKFGEIVIPSKNPVDRFNVGKLNRDFENGKSKVETIGRLNQVEVPQVQPKLLSGNVNPFPNDVPAKVVEGPVFLKRTADEATAFLAEREKFSKSGDFKGFTDDDNKLIQTAREIVHNTEGGQEPIPFKTAFSLLHGEGGSAGIETVSSLKPGELSPTKDILSNIGQSLHRDIQDSLSGWKLGGDEALDAYNLARASSLTKKVLSEGGNVQNLISTTNAPIPQIDKALQNPIQTQKLLNTSNLEGVKSNNMRQDLAGYRLQQIWNKADSGQGVINGERLIEEWNDPAYQTTKDQLYSKGTQDQIGQFFQNVSKVTQNGMGGQYGLVRLGYHGISLAGSLLTGGLTGHALGNFAAMEIPPYALAKLMTNPAKAQILQRLVANEPLEMSTQQAGRLIMSGLNGVNVGLVGGDGKRKTVKISNGQVQ